MYLITLHHLIYSDSIEFLENVALHQDFSEACNSVRELVRQRMEWLKTNMPKSDLSFIEFGGQPDDAAFHVLVFDKNDGNNHLASYRVNFVPIAN